MLKKQPPPTHIKQQSLDGHSTSSQPTKTSDFNTIRTELNDWNVTIDVVIICDQMSVLANASETLESKKQF